MKSTLSSALVLILLSHFTKLVSADFSIYIPGFEPQGLSATVLGIGSDGRTTYQISPVESTGSSAHENSNPTFTFVEGPTDAFYTMKLPDHTGTPDILYESCSFGSNTGGQAVCVISASGPDLNIQGVATGTEMITLITVEGNTAFSSVPSTSTSPTPSTGGTSGGIPSFSSAAGPSSPPDIPTGGNGASSASNTVPSPTNTGAAHPLLTTGPGGVLDLFVAGLIALTLIL